MDIQIFGITANISWLSLIIVAIFTFDAFYYIKRESKGQTTSTYLWVGFLAALSIVISVIFHEFSHALAATTLGVKIVGAGMTWWGAYVSPGEVTISPINEVLICFAGPLANAFLAGLATSVVFFQKETLFENSAQYFALININLALFNMLPLGGLDGHKVLESINQIAFNGSQFSFWAIAVPLIVVIFVTQDAARDWLRKL